MIGSNNAVVLATEQTDPAQASVTFPDGTVKPFGVGGSNYVLGIEPGKGIKTIESIITSGSGWYACEPSGSKLRPERGRLKSDIMSRQQNLVDNGFSGATGDVYDAYPNATPVDVYSS